MHDGVCHSADMSRVAICFGLIGAIVFGVWLLSAPTRDGAVVFGPTLQGAAVVTDGDTIRINDVPVRLHGIDAPEADQDCTTEHGFPFACGDVATNILRQALDRQVVTCVALDEDRYGRIVARCFAQGRDVGQEMVAAGYARAYSRYSAEYEPDEAAARAAGLGLWSANMQSPATFRSLTRETTPPPDSACAIKGNLSDNGRIYHLPGQDWYDRTRINAAAGERWFCSTQEAEAAGWRMAER